MHRFLVVIEKAGGNYSALLSDNHTFSHVFEERPAVDLTDSN